MSSKSKSHKAMGDGEWMARLRAFASSGVWPSGGGNRPSPRQQKWHNICHKIDKCPMQNRGQTSLFGVSMDCNCGFHTTKPATATQSPAAPPQSGASDPASAPRSFLRPPLSLSMFTKSRFGGSQLASLKPNLVGRRTPSPSPSPSSVRIPSPSPSSPSPSPSSVRPATTSPSSVRTPNPSSSSVRTPNPSPSSVRTPNPSPSSVRTDNPSSSFVRTDNPSSSFVRTDNPSSSSVRTDNPSSSFVRTPSPSPSPVRSHSHASFSEESEGVQPAPAEASASFWLPGEWNKTIPVQDQRWIANTLFHSGRLRPDLKLWYEPPVPALIYHQTPTPDRFFTHRLMVWMPYHCGR